MHAMALLTAEVAGITAGVVIGVGLLALGTRALSRRHKAQQARGRHRAAGPALIEGALR